MLKIMQIIWRAVLVAFDQFNSSVHLKTKIIIK